MDVSVIGGGIVGVATAKRLVGDGHHVTLFEPSEIGGPMNAAYANGAMISSGFMVPISSPGLWRQVPGYLVSPQSPVSVRWRDFPGRALWALRFLAAGATRARQQGLAAALAPLMRDAPAQHAQMAAGTDAAGYLQDRALYVLYPDAAAREGDTAWDLRAAHDVTHVPVEQGAFRQETGAVPEGYGAAMSIEDTWYCTDNFAYIKALLAGIPEDRLTVVPAQVEGFVIEAEQVTHVRHGGTQTACDAVVLCAGWASGPLAAMLGDRVPLGVERGYSIEYPSNPIGLTRPLMLSDKRLAVTPTDFGLRFAGQVEIAHPQAPEDPSHFDILHKRAVEVFPALAGLEKDARRWMGRRPSMIDCRPVIGSASGVANGFYAFGHGHIGLTSAPRTAAMVADLMAGRPTEISSEPYAPRRFGR